MSHDSLPGWLCFAAAAALVVFGTLGTGLLPPKPAFQAIAGAAIVGGFALVYGCLYASGDGDG
ncbi:MAG: hypothetical protein ABEJ85_04735 [Haloarculaceae archaeon]